MLQSNIKLIPGGMYPGRRIIITATPGPNRYTVPVLLFDISFKNIGVLIRKTEIIALKFLL